MERYLSVPVPKNLRGRFTFEPVLQLGHMLGVNVSNWNDVGAERTASIQKFFGATSQFRTLRVQTDTSWLTASARYINAGTGAFLLRQPSDGLQQLGTRLIRADRISNDGFMFFASAERFLQQNILAGDNSAETVETQAMMRACAEKVFQSYYQELGGIFDDLRHSPTIALELAEAVERDASRQTVSEGNFIGLVLAIWAMGKTSIQDAVPFVWGADGLTQFNERSGVEKYKFYRDQLAVDSLMEIVATTLEQLGDPRGRTWRDILTQIRLGPQRDAPFWEPAPEHLNISTQGISDSDRATVVEQEIAAAMGPVPHGNRKPVTTRQLKPHSSRL